MRGHGALLGAVDTTISVVKTETGRTATVIKANDAEEGQQVAFNLESVEVERDDDGETTAPVAVPTETQTATAAAPALKLTKNQQTMFTLLYDAGPGGLTTEEWNERAREAGLGTPRKADLYDFRTALKAKKLVNEYANRWTVRHQG